MTRVEVIRAEELTPELTARWAQIQRSDARYASPFFHPEFTRIVAESRDDVHVAVLETDGGPAGFFPFQRDRLGMGRPIGWRLNDYQGVIADPSAEWTARDLVRASGLRWFDYDHVPAAQEQFSPHHRAWRVSPVVEMPDGFERYADAQREAGVKSVNQVRSKRRRLERDFGPVRFEPDVDDPDLVSTLFEWKSAQYQRTGAADLLAQGWFRAVYERAATASSDGFKGMFSVLWAGDRPIALHLGLRSEAVWHHWLPAYDDDRAVARSSPGLVLTLGMLEEADRLGVRTLDFGGGDTPWKREFANAEVSLAVGWVGSASPLAAARRAWREARARASRSGLPRRARRLATRLRPRR